MKKKFDGKTTLPSERSREALEAMMNLDDVEGRKQELMKLLKQQKTEKR